MRCFGPSRFDGGWLCEAAFRRLLPVCCPTSHCFVSSLPATSPLQPPLARIAPATSCGTARPDLGEPSLTPKPARALLVGTDERRPRWRRSAPGERSQHVAHGKIAPRHHVDGGA